MREIAQRNVPTLPLSLKEREAFAKKYPELIFYPKPPGSTNEVRRTPQAKAREKET